jgi:hypothetical protein
MRTLWNFLSNLLIRINRETENFYDQRHTNTN